MYVRLNSNVALRSATGRCDLNVCNSVLLVKQIDHGTDILIRGDLNVYAETTVLLVKNILNTPEGRYRKNRANIDPL